MFYKTYINALWTFFHLMAKGFSNESRAPNITQLANHRPQTYYSYDSSRQSIIHASLVFHSATLQLHLVTIDQNPSESKNAGSRDGQHWLFLTVLMRRYFVPPAWFYLIHCCTLPFINIYSTMKWRNETKFSKPTENSVSIHCIVTQEKCF